MKRLLSLKVVMLASFRNPTLLAAITLACAGSAAAAELKQRDTEQVSNARRETQILTSFSKAPRLHEFDLLVSVDANKVMLRGAVENDIEKDLARGLAMAAKGINFVDNRIEVDAGPMRPRTVNRESSGVGEKIEDAAITAAIKSKLRENSSTAGLNIRIDTTNGKVTLTGNTRSGGEKRSAARLAMDTDGVTAVDNQISLGAKIGARRGEER